MSRSSRSITSMQLFIKLKFATEQVSLTSSTNCQRPLHGLQFFFVDKAWMRTIADINLPLVRSQMPYHILRPKAIPHSPNLLTPQLRPHLHQTGVNNRIDCRGQMAA